MAELQRFSHWILRGLTALAITLGLAAGPAAAADRITVFAAASMKTALDGANAAFTRETGQDVAVSYAASSALARQVEAGAPADVFISADLDWMDYLEHKNLIRPETRRNLLGNRIVLIAPKSNPKAIDITPGFDLVGLIGDGRLAMGAVDSVPAGKYGKAALEKLGVWDSVSARVAGAENVRAALALVSRGEAPYGIVYETDAKADQGVVVVGTFPQDSHPPIIYPIAQVSSSQSAGVPDYLRFLLSEKAAEFFRSQGFTVLK
jgi:molybdate transport system substrate-binding protein